jgi:hypothetical protein
MVLVRHTRLTVHLHDYLHEKGHKGNSKAQIYKRAYAHSRNSMEVQGGKLQVRTTAKSQTFQ